MELRTVARTALANLIRFGSGLVMIVATPFLLHRLGDSAYAVWVVVIQVTTFVSLMEVGVGDAVVRFVAPHAHDDRLDPEAAGIMRASFVVETLFAVAGGVLAAVLTVLLTRIFSGIPPELRGTAQFGFFLVGVAAAAHLFVGPLGGYFNAVHRNIPPAFAMLLVRVVAMGFVVVMAAHGLRPAVIAMAIGLGANLVVQSAMFKLDFRDFRLFGPIDRVEVRAILSHCSTMMIWSAAGFLVSGLDTSVVGAFDFGRVAAYAIATSATALVFGIHSSLISAFIPDISKRHALGDEAGVTNVVMTAGSFANLYLVLACVSVAAFGRVALHLWVGVSMGRSVYPLFLALTVAKTVGALMSPYVAGLIGTGDHKRVRVTPLVEGITNLGFSILFTWRLGAVGAALGTLVGCAVGAALHLFWNIPRTTKFHLRRRQYLFTTVVPALLAGVPLGLVALLHPHLTVVYAGLLGIATLASLGMSLKVVRTASIARRAA